MKILEQNFLVPQVTKNEFGNRHHRTVNVPAYGLGIYIVRQIFRFSEILWQGEIIHMCGCYGEIYTCDRSMRNCSLKPGNESHMSQFGNEWVVFNSGQIVLLCVFAYQNIFEHIRRSLDGQGEYLV